MAYFDESGDRGYLKSPTVTFTLAGCLVHENQWLPALDALVEFRRDIKKTYSVPVREELKAHYLLHGKGVFKKVRLSDTARLDIYTRAIDVLRTSGFFRVFAVAINKDKIRKQEYDPAGFAWQYAFERLEKFLRGTDEHVHVLPDEGHGFLIRRTLRNVRRGHQVPSHYGAELLNFATTAIVEDPSDRVSHASYFIQMADLCAYAAARRVHPTGKFGGQMWDSLGDCRIEKVNKLSGGPVGIKVWPQ